MAGIAAIMDEMGMKLGTITGLQVKPWNALSVVPPAAVIELPTDISYHTEYGRGAYSAKTRVHVVTGRVSDEVSRDVISKFLDTQGDHSIYQRLDSGTDNTYTTCHVVSVMDADTATMEMAGIDYIDAVFTIDFVGKGLIT